MAVTYRHVVTFSGNTPRSKPIRIETYSKLKDVPSLGHNQIMVSGSKPQMMNPDISYGTYDIVLGNQVLMPKNDDEALDIILNRITGPKEFQYIMDEMAEIVRSDRFGEWTWNADGTYVALTIKPK